MPININNRIGSGQVAPYIDKQISWASGIINQIKNKDKDPDRLSMLNTPTENYTTYQKTLARLNPDIESDKNSIKDAQSILDKLSQNKSNLENNYLKFYSNSLGTSESINNDINNQTSNLMKGSGIEETRQKGFAVGQASNRGDTQAMKSKIIDDVVGKGIADRLKLFASQQDKLIQNKSNQQQLLMGVGQQLQQQKQQDISNKMAQDAQNEQTRLARAQLNRR